jgi:glycosyltransferase involved in cell wall biosynthesis
MGKMKKIRLSVVIPAYNDAFTIAQVIQEADAAAREIADRYEIRVINDASSDGTAGVLDKLSRQYKRLVVSTHQHNQGYGGTIRELYLTATQEWIFSVPGDNQIPPAEVEKLVPYADSADMIIGRRVNRNDPPERLRQSRVYNALLRLLYGLELNDVNSVRLMKRDVVRSIELTSLSAFVDAELAIDAKKAGFTIVEVPINHRARNDEGGAGGGSMKTILPTVMDMIKYRIFKN